MTLMRNSDASSSSPVFSYYRLFALLCAFWLLFAAQPQTAGVYAARREPSAAPATAKLTLLTVENTTRGLAFESTTFKPEPFAVVSGTTQEPNRVTRIILFASNLTLLPGEDTSHFSADAEDGSHRVYPLAVEHIEPVRLSNLHYFVVRLDKAMADVGDVLVRVSKNGVASNRVRIGMGRIGGGPPDDGAPVDPAPAITVTSISPASVLAGSAATNVFLTGSGFSAGSVARFNGTARKTSFVNDSLLSVLLEMTDLRLAGSFAIQVADGGEGARISNRATFTVRNPVPALSGLSSAAANAGDKNFTLIVYGTNFVSNSVVSYQGSNRVTKFINSTQLEAQILAGDLQTAGQYQIKVSNPTPGGGQSNALPFNVNQVATPTPTPVSGNQFYVSTKGSASGNGSAASPWDLQTAFNHPAAVKPGDTIWIAGGTYRGVYASKLTGTEVKPIHVRAARNQRVTIDVNDPAVKRREVVINGAYAWYWNLEIVDSDTKRVTPTNGSQPADMPRVLSSLTVFGHHVKIINPITHDLANGISFWDKATDSEIHGALTFNNGWNAPDRGHGHGIYAQNQTGTKNIREIISFNNFSTGMQAFGVNGYVSGFNIDGIISFNNGSPAAILRNNPTSRDRNLIVGSGEKPSNNIRVANAHLYYPIDNISNNLHLGFYAPDSTNVKVENSYIIRGQRNVFLNDWKSITFTGNTLWLTRGARLGPKLIHVVPGAGKTLGDYKFDNNKYYDTSFVAGDKAFQWQGSQNLFLSFNEWKAQGADQRSTYTQTQPTGQEIFIRPNGYDKGRAHIVVYNWTGGSSAAVNLGTAGLVAGDVYEIRDAQDYFGAPVLTGTYNNALVQLPLAKRAAVKPIGMSQGPAHTGPEFHVLVVVKK